MSSTQCFNVTPLPDSWDKLRSDEGWLGVGCFEVGPGRLALSPETTDINRYRSGADRCKTLSNVMLSLLRCLRAWVTLRKGVVEPEECVSFPEDARVLVVSIEALAAFVFTSSMEGMIAKDSSKRAKEVETSSSLLEV